MTSEDEALIRRLEADGEETVREDLRKGLHTSRDPLVRQWLAGKTRAKEAKQEAFQAEQTEIARSAMQAAWVSAKEAKRANLLAWIAIVISIAAIVVAVLSVGFQPQPDDTILRKACQFLRLPCGQR